MRFYLGLVHYPIKNKNGELINTSVTNLDIHDISRSCRTFGIINYYLVTPIELQKDLVKTILGHWAEDHANQYNPDRHNALSIARAVDSVEETIAIIEKNEGQRPLVVVTGANFEHYDGDETSLTNKVEQGNIPCLILFGTGHGLHDELLKIADFKLKPIHAVSSDGYNHLSVRSAVAIYLDRLFGNR